MQLLSVIVGDFLLYDLGLFLSVVSTSTKFERATQLYVRLTVDSVGFVLGHLIHASHVWKL